MLDYVAHEIPSVPDSIVYVVNSKVTQVIPVANVPEKLRGFMVPIRDEQGNITVRYVKTAMVKTRYLDDEGNEVSMEEATAVITQFLDEKGNVIHRPLSVMMRE